MTSIKRLLNYPEDGEVHHHQQLQKERLHQALISDFEETPILQEQSWGEFLDHLFLPGHQQPASDQNQIFDGSVDESFQFAQEGITNWAVNDLSLSLTASTSQSEVEDDTAQSDSINYTANNICYGMIFRASVKLTGDMSNIDAKLSEGSACYAAGHYNMTVAKLADQLSLSLSDGTTLGILNTQLSKALQDVLESYEIDLEALAHIQTLRDTIGRASKASDAVFRVNINIYGPKRLSKPVGRLLSNYKWFLQRPDYQRKGSTYDNPHYLKLADVPLDPIKHEPCDPADPTAETDKAERFRSTISKVYASLKRGEHLIGVEGDGRLSTTLLPHQKEALDFMAQRESGPVPEEFRLWQPIDIEGYQWYCHSITKARCRIAPNETGGGILADEMGMGKSLSILSLILRTLEDAHSWASEGQRSPSEGIVNTKRLSRATLIVASSALMINEWLKELEQHLHHEVHSSIKTIKYHGQRETDTLVLRDCDIVITTYHTLAADFARPCNPLNEIEWYRIVLDEAHIIRRQATGLNRTVCELHAKNRWCLTGTPIQNRLEDIGALFAFIRASPFESMSTFRRFIAIPFDEGGERRRVAVERLGVLVDSLSLRRTKELLHLPEKHDQTRFLDFSNEEREQYQQTKTIMIRAIRQRAGEFDRTSMFGMFQAQLQLRIFCNHGTFQHAFSWARRSLLDEKEAACALGRNGETKCSSCRQSMPIISSNSIYRRYIENCAHILCSECMEESSREYNENSSDPEHCPLCFPFITSGHCDGTNNGERTDYFLPQGHSTKMAALVSDVKNDLWNSKSIIFSCWTRTLDLIAKYLHAASIPFERIDGECPLPRRQRILDDFARNGSLPVLIMTTGTGAFGLNLTSANRVFIVEPQWNPSVENQAIARALRLGQGQSVLVTRYVINHTVEQDMRSQQNRKLRIAEIGWE